MGIFRSRSDHRFCQSSGRHPSGETWTTAWSCCRGQGRDIHPRYAYTTRLTYLQRRPPPSRRRRDHDAEVCRSPHLWENPHDRVCLVSFMAKRLLMQSCQKGPPTCNPHDPSRTPGGSSSGSGAVVGDFQVPLSLGTQTGGSTIRPASYNGIFALKPTHNAISREGLKMCMYRFWPAVSCGNLLMPQTPSPVIPWACILAVSTIWRS